MSLSQQTNKSASIVKSGFLWKRGVGVFGNSYKERLFVLKLTGKLDYFDVSSGKKILKGTILLSASSKITIRKNLPPNQQKFIIETKERQWYLWCRHNKNAKQHVEEWYNSINNMINSAKSSTKPLANDHKQTATEIAQPTATGHHLENNDTEQASGSSDELFGDYPTANDIIITRPTNPNQPFNPFYGGSITNIQSQTDNNNETVANNPYYAPLEPVNNMSIKASAPTLEQKDTEIDSKFDEDDGFKLSENISLKSALFGSWVSYNNDNGGYLCGVRSSPMVNERFVFKCIDRINNIYTIQTFVSGLYLSSTNDGSIKFMKRLYGIYEQWIIAYHHINKISITSKYYATHFGIDAHGLFHHRYPSITNIVQFVVSPPVILNKSLSLQMQAPIQAQTQQQVQSMEEQDKHIKYPQIDGLSIAFCCCGVNGNFLGVENRECDVLRTDYTTSQSFDGELLTRSTFCVEQDINKYRLYAFKCALNGKYISVSEGDGRGKIVFVSETDLSEKEYFEIIWYDVNIISLLTFDGKIFAVQDNALCVEAYDTNLNIKTDCLFEIKSKEFSKINRMNAIHEIPYCQLPIRSINGQIKRDIWLKGVGDEKMGYLAFRCKPYRYEAVSRVMGKWETLRFAHDLVLNSYNKTQCIVSLFTENGMIIACDNMAQITFLTKEKEKDILRSRWKIYFHNYSLISIQNCKYKGWMILKQHIKQPNIYMLSIINANFDANGKPIIDVKHERLFKNVYCQFELCPFANCKQNIHKNNKKQNSAVSFSM